jgi:hypothetical protein
VLRLRDAEVCELQLTVAREQEVPGTHVAVDQRQRLALVVAQLVGASERARALRDQAERDVQR